MTLDSHAARTLVLGCWSAFLAWLWVSGETARYLGPRTQWVVPFGALCLGLLAVAYGRSLRGAGDGPLRPRPKELLGLGAMIVPILFGCVLAHASLGSAAASKKLSARGVDPSQLAALDSQGSKGVGYLELKASEHNAAYAAKNGLHPGRSVQLLGFVQGSPKSARAPFQIARFYIGCCVADAVPLAITVLRDEIKPVELRKDQWVQLNGSVTRRGKGYVLQAETIKKVPQPHHPYLYFSDGI